MGGLTRLSLVFLEDLPVDIGSVGLFSSVDKARLLVIRSLCLPSFLPLSLGCWEQPWWISLQRGMMIISNLSSNIQQLPNVKRREFSNFFQHVFILLISIATLCNSFHMDAVLWWSFLRSQGGLHHWARMWWHQRREPRDDGFIRFIWDERCVPGLESKFGYIVLFHICRW